MDWFVAFLALITFVSTLIGGFIIVKFKDSLHYFFAFAAGSLIAVSFLDILPESIEIAGNAGIPLRTIFLTVVLSFFFYSILEKFFLTHPMEHGHDHGHIMGPIGAGSLVIHSLLDGAAIGAAFHVNASIGLIVALAVISHDFTDGMNTVTLMLKNKHKVNKAIAFLILDALAPVVGVMATALIFIPESVLAIILAVFVGEFLYIGAATLVPEMREHPSKKVIIAMALGILLIVFLTSLIA